MLDLFDILQEPRFWIALTFALAPIAVGIIMLISRR